MESLKALSCLVYTLLVKKTRHYTFVRNFTKPIFKNYSLLDSVGNILPQPKRVTTLPHEISDWRYLLTLIFRKVV